MSQKTQSPSASTKKLRNPATDRRTQGRYHDDDTSHVSVTIGVTPDVAFSFFRDLKNLPLFMKDLTEVKVLSPKKSHWVVQLKAGEKVEWDAEITSERAGEMVAWRSLDGSDIETSGAIWFSPAPEGLGTVIGLTMSYKIPGGKLAELITKMTGEDPESLTFINLRRLKAYLETGEIATTEGQPSGRDADAEMIVKH